MSATARCRWSRGPPRHPRKRPLPLCGQHASPVASTLPAEPAEPAVRAAPDVAVPYGPETPVARGPQRHVPKRGLPPKQRHVPKWRPLPKQRHVPKRGLPPKQRHVPKRGRPPDRSAARNGSRAPGRRCRRRLSWPQGPASSSQMRARRRRRSDPAEDPAGREGWDLFQSLQLRFRRITRSRVWARHRNLSVSEPTVRVSHPAKSHPGRDLPIVLMPVTFIGSPKAGDMVAGPGMTFSPCH